MPESVWTIRQRLTAVLTVLALWVPADQGAGANDARGNATSSVFPKVPRHVPGGSTDVGHPWRGDVKVGRNSREPLRTPQDGNLPPGVVYDPGEQVITVTASASGGTLRDFSLLSVQVLFGPDVSDFTIKDNVIRNGKSDIRTGVIDLNNNAPRKVVIRHNDFIGIRPAEHRTFAKEMSAWVFPGTEPFILAGNVMTDAPGDQIKFSAMTCEENFVYGGGVSPGAHFDGAQLNQLTGPVVIRNNYFNGVADEASHGATNSVRLVPFGSPPERHPVLIEDNVFRGMGWQIEVDRSLEDVTVRNNHQGDWTYGSRNPQSTGFRYYGNRNLHTGQVIPALNSPH
jgi:hypothetical protein